MTLNSKPNSFMIPSLMCNKVMSGKKRHSGTHIQPHQLHDTVPSEKLLAFHCCLMQFTRMLHVVIALCNSTSGEHVVQSINKKRRSGTHIQAQQLDHKVCNDGVALSWQG